MRRQIPLLLLVSLLTLLTACNDGGGPAARTVSVTLLHSNDSHSRIESEGSPAEGGIARRKSLIDRLRGESAEGRTLLVDAGDYFQGSLYFNAWKGSEAVMALNHLGYDAVALGNHEFDLGPAALARALRGGAVTIAGVGYAAEARLPPVVAANLDVSAEPDLAGLVLPYTVVEKGGVRFGIIGVITEEVAHISSIGDRVAVADYVASVQRSADALAAAGIDKVILLSHAGYRRDLALAPALTGVDVVVSGHDHALLGDAAEFAAAPETAALATHVAGDYPTVARAADGAPVLVVSAYERGVILGALDITFDPRGRVAAWKGRPWHVGASIPEDAALAQTVTAYKEPISAFADAVIGAAAVEFDAARIPGVRSREMPLGNLVSDSMLEAARASDGVVAAITNGGGLRAGIAQGTVTFGQALAVLPFGNTIVVVEVTGEELVAALDNGIGWAYDAARGPRSSGAFPQLAGMAVSYCDAAVEAIRAGTAVPPCTGALLSGGLVTGVTVAGAPLAMQAHYRVAVNDYMARGGDYYTVFSSACGRPGGYCRDTGLLMVDELVRTFATGSPVRREIEGRIVGR